VSASEKIESVECQSSDVSISEGNAEHSTEGFVFLIPPRFDTKRGFDGSPAPLGSCDGRYPSADAVVGGAWKDRV
jgi:hypothetical protein